MEMSKEDAHGRLLDRDTYMGMFGNSKKDCFEHIEIKNKKNFDVTNYVENFMRIVREIR